MQERLCGTQQLSVRGPSITSKEQNVSVQFKNSFKSEGLVFPSSQMVT